jgi:hypothetical protein
MTGTTDPHGVTPARERPAAGVQRPMTPAEERKQRFDREADEQIERFEQRWDYQRY